MNNPIYPWQTSLWEHLVARRHQLSHAMLFKGPVGIGKLVFAETLAKSLLCSNPTPQGFACHACQSCHWLETESHPDFRILTPEQDDAAEEGTKAKTRKRVQILMAQVQALNAFFEMCSHQHGGQRVIIIHPAEALNTTAANALLKMLEEPPARVQFILISHQPQKLLPTILSRCLQYTMPVASFETALDWLEAQGVKDAALRLQYAGGSPLAAQLLTHEEMESRKDIWAQLSQGGKLDVFQLAPQLLVQGMEVATDIIQKWMYDILSYNLARQVRYHPQLLEPLARLAGVVNLASLLSLMRELSQARASANHPLNNELQLETLLVRYTHMFEH